MADSTQSSRAQPGTVPDSGACERLLADVTARFAGLPVERFDEAVDQSLRQIVATFDVERSTLTSIDLDTGWFRATHSWAVDDLPRVPMAKTSRHAYPWAWARFTTGRQVTFARLDDLPAEATLDRASYARIGLRSHVGTPIMVAGELVGMLGIGTMRRERAWPDALLVRLRPLANVFAMALARKRLQNRLGLVLAFERLLADLSTSLVGAAGADLDAEVNGALRAVRQLLDVDRVRLWQLEAPGRFAATHEALERDRTETPARINALELPWIAAALKRGQAISFGSIAELPPGTDTERDALQAAGVKAMMAVPLHAREEVVGALSLLCYREERIWPQELVPRVRLLGRTLITALLYDKTRRAVDRASNETAQVRERLAHLARVDAVSAMSAAVAHEVNQPLAAILNYALAGRRRLTGRAAIDRDKLDELLDKIASQAGHAGKVLERLRAMVRRHEVREEEVDLRLLIGEVLKLVEMEGRLRDVRIEVAVPADLPRGFGDEIQLQQVILNLARNGMEAMATVHGADKVLRVEALAHADDEVVIRVIDNGDGISAEDEERVFDPFHSTKDTGLGIGLAICRSIVESHGGRLWHVPNPAGGAIFQFTLPSAGRGGEE